MQYSWPGPLPPGAPRRTIRLIRCAECGGALYQTKAKGQPWQEDHKQGCETFITAMRVMRYVDALKHSASRTAGRRGSGWRRRYLRENAKKLTVAACTSDPAAELRTLGDLYEAECQTPGQRVISAEKTEQTEMLMRACWQMSAGKEPAPITGENGLDLGP